MHIASCIHFFGSGTLIFKFDGLLSGEAPFVHIGVFFPVYSPFFSHFSHFSFGAPLYVLLKMSLWIFSFFAVLFSIFLPLLTTWLLSFQSLILDLFYSKKIIILMTFIIDLIFQATNIKPFCFYFTTLTIPICASSDFIIILNSFKGK